ncbi:MAG TPA: plastocyanin/azurin family copper-binding protein [bacterium]|nr:plastocyanin/azurin family copper-binding protein [bacterium]
MLLRALAVALSGALLAGPAMAATHQVMQDGVTFDPPELEIEVGDTVEWIHSAGNHTVTHGTDDANPPLADKLFDEPLSVTVPLVSHTFDEAGDFDYYCRFHLSLNMTGVIRVMEPTPAPEPTFSSWAGVKNLYR